MSFEKGPLIEPQAVAIEHRAFRTDIQALRGIAILEVLLFHAQPAMFSAGYLGVDVFFVVSGYLITSLLKRSIEQGSFSFREFYFRRAKRLLPAAYVTFAVTALLSPLLLTAQERLDFGKQLLGGLSFSTNFVLWKQIDYFNPSSHLKPLVHIWSLAIEEQFYLLLPAVMFLVPNRFWLRFIACCFLASAMLCWIYAPIQPTASFYLLPTRGWELAMGSVGALCGVTIAGRLRSILFWPALCLLVLIPAFPVSTIHPRWDALLVCSATLTILLCDHPVSGRSGIARLLASTGDFSYSLYLVHWPILAFANNCWLTPVPTAVRVALVASAIGLGYLLYRVVEKPIWQSTRTFSMRSVVPIVAFSLVLAIAAVFVGYAGRPAVDYANARRVNRGFSSICDSKDETFRPLPECTNSRAPRMMVWGDSYAMALVPGIAATTDVGIIQATRSVCGPFLGLAPFDNEKYGKEWARACIVWNDSVLAYLKANTSIDTVVVSSPFVQYVGVSRGPQKGRLLIKNGSAFIEREVGVHAALAAMQHTVATVRELGKRVVVVAPPPSDNYDTSDCLERRASGLPILGLQDTDCRISVSAYHENSSRVLSFLDQLTQQTGASVFSFDSLLCKADSCETALDGTILYRDRTHLSYAGSELLGRKTSLSERLLRIAR